MSEATLTEFIDFVRKSGAPKATQAKTIKARRQVAYSPSSDFYAILRDHIVDAHAKGLGKAHVSGAAAATSHAARAQHYRTVGGSYARWWGKKKIQWFKPPRAIWSSGGTDVVVNPELGLRINGTPTVVKLYFKGDKLAKKHADLIIELMEHALRPSVSPKNAEMAVLDVRNRRLFRQNPGTSQAMLSALLAGEASSLATIWPHV